MREKAVITFVAIALEIKTQATVMAGTAVFAVIHSLHSKISFIARAACLHIKELHMTLVAGKAEFLIMQGVVKKDRLERFFKENSIWGIDVITMTAATVGFVLNTEGYGSVMAGTAVLPFPE